MPSRSSRSDPSGGLSSDHAEPRVLDNQRLPDSQRVRRFQVTDDKEVLASGRSGEVGSVGGRQDRAAHDRRSLAIDDEVDLSGGAVDVAELRQDVLMADPGRIRPEALRKVRPNGADVDGPDLSGGRDGDVSRVRGR